MPSRFDDDFAAASSPDLLSELGEDVTRYPLGDTEAEEPATAIFEEDSPSRMDGRGEEVERTGTLEVDAAVAVDVRDSWLIRDEEWQTLTVKAAEGGLRTLTVQRNDLETRMGAGEGLR